MQKCIIGVNDFNESNTGKFRSVRELSSIEDVATLLETFELALQETSSNHIVDVVENDKRFYFFVTNTEGDSQFDFYTFLNSKYKGQVEITPVNAKFVFPLSKSRGVYDTDFDEVEDVTDNIEEDAATGFMDEEELDAIVSGEHLQLLYIKTNTKIPITPEGVIIGRSSKESQFIIRGNGNLSRKHARVYMSGGEAFLENFTPQNGTFLNGLRMGNNTTERIEKGNDIILAGEEFKVV